MQHIPLLAKQLGKEFFTEQLVNLCIGWLGDSISSIREAAAENLKVRKADHASIRLFHL
jgi:serine/threonine-protein phosphatase 2A regulatory subunit A